MDIISKLYTNYDQETLKEVQKLEGLEHKLVKHRGAQVFNLQCLHEEVIPTGCKIKFKCYNFAKSNIIRRAE